MTLAFGIAIYFIIWWTVLFAVLPIGVRTSEEAGEKITPGNAESAPHMPNLLPKMVATTVVSTIIFATSTRSSCTVSRSIRSRSSRAMSACSSRTMGEGPAKKARPRRPCFSNTNSLISSAHEARPSVFDSRDCWLKSGCAYLGAPGLLLPNLDRSNLNVISKSIPARSLPRCERTLARQRQIVTTIVAGCRRFILDSQS